MNVSRTIYERFRDDNDEFDIGKFVEAILLFDKVLLSDSSVLPELIRAIGTDGVLQLLETALLGIVGGGPSAQAKCDYISPGFFKNRLLHDPLKYGFETIFVDPNHPNNPSVEERLERDLDNAKKIMPIRNKELINLKSAIFRDLIVIDNLSLNTVTDFRVDIEHNMNFITDVIIDHISRNSRYPVRVLNIQMHIEEIDDSVFQINSDLGAQLDINDRELHDLFKAPFFQITGTNLQLHRMRAVGAASGLTDAQANITAKRIDFLSRVHSDGDTRGKFTKIRELANVPILEPGSKLDINGLIALRDSDEARRFRDWLQSSPILEEHEIEEMLQNWRAKLGELLNHKGMKTLRWLGSTGAGELIGPGGGIITGVLDKFVSKFLPGMGPIGFIVNDYDQFINSAREK